MAVPALPAMLPSIAMPPVSPSSEAAVENVS